MHSFEGMAVARHPISSGAHIEFEDKQIKPRLVFGRGAPDRHTHIG